MHVHIHACTHDDDQDGADLKNLLESSDSDDEQGLITDIHEHALQAAVRRTHIIDEEYGKEVKMLSDIQHERQKLLEYADHRLRELPSGVQAECCAILASFWIRHTHLHACPRTLVPTCAGMQAHVCSPASPPHTHACMHAGLVARTSIPNCTHLCTAHVHVRAEVHAHSFACPHALARAHTYECTSLCTYALVRAHPCARPPVCLRADVHADVHVCTHAHMHMCACAACSHALHACMHAKFLDQAGPAVCFVLARRRASKGVHECKAAL